MAPRAQGRPQHSIPVGNVSNVVFDRNTLPISMRPAQLIGLPFVYKKCPFSLMPGQRHFPHQPLCAIPPRPVPMPAPAGQRTAAVAAGGVRKMAATQKWKEFAPRISYFPWPSPRGSCQASGVEKQRRASGAGIRDINEWKWKQNGGME